MTMEKWKGYGANYNIPQNHPAFERQQRVQGMDEDDSSDDTSSESSSDSSDGSSSHDASDSDSE